VKNLLSTEAICGNLITIKPFSARAPLPDPAGRAHDLSQTPELDGEGGYLIDNRILGYLLPIFLLLLSRDPREPRFPSELVYIPPFRPNLRPCLSVC